MDKMNSFKVTRTRFYTVTENCENRCKVAIKSDLFLQLIHHVSKQIKAKRFKLSDARACKLPVYAKLRLWHMQNLDKKQPVEKKTFQLTPCTIV